MDDQSEDQLVHQRESDKRTLWGGVRLSRKSQINLGIINCSVSRSHGWNISESEIKMSSTQEYSQLVAGLVGQLLSKGYNVINVLGHSDYPDPKWQNWKDDWELPDVIAEDRKKGLIIIGEAETAESVYSEATERKLAVFSRCAHEVYLMVPPEELNRARSKLQIKRYANVTVLTT